jgi:hypothetical protein
VSGEYSHPYVPVPNGALQQSGDLLMARFARFIDSPAAELGRYVAPNALAS